MLSVIALFKLFVCIGPEGSFCIFTAKNYHDVTFFVVCSAKQTCFLTFGFNVHLIKMCISAARQYFYSGVVNERGHITPSGVSVISHRKPFHNCHVTTV